MADSKVSQLDLLTAPAGNDEIYIIDSASVPVSKKITLDVLLGNLPSNVSITGTFGVTGNTNFSANLHTFSANASFQDINPFKINITGNTLTIENSFTPANSAIAGVRQGAIIWDENFLYVRTSNTTFKRVALSTF